MNLDLAGKDNDIAYKVLTALITPRPIAWVSTLNEDGGVNVAPFSFFNVFGSAPPLVIFGVGNKAPGIPKDTVRNIEREKEYVINLVDEHVAEAMNLSAAAHPYGESELDHNGCTTAPTLNLRTPRIAEAPVSLECKLHEIQKIGGNRIVIGIAGNVTIRDGILDPETKYLNGDAFPVIGRMQGPDGYVRCRDRFSMQWPRV
ncbi:MAG: flavin reductase family protein [Verrucomicrobia bacterium]|nr:flavin reductase family protein [Verrucomicrobiota bacterium]MCH8512452.1 flavin reductase family protein [Kiritimatiellia bacterium]